MAFVQNVKERDDGAYVFTIAGDERELHDIQYNLDPKPHEYTIRKGLGATMDISSDDMSRILSRFANME